MRFFQPHSLSDGLQFTPFVSAEPHPKTQAALEHLNAAKATLSHAGRDKGGHRGKAIGLIDESQKQIREGEVFDNRHVELKRRR